MIISGVPAYGSRNRRDLEEPGEPSAPRSTSGKRPSSAGRDWPYLRIDATYLKVRQTCRVPVAVIVAVGVNADGCREVLGTDIGPSEAEPFWSASLHKFVRRGLRGETSVESEAHEGTREDGLEDPQRHLAARHAARVLRQKRLNLPPL